MDSYVIVIRGQAGSVVRGMFDEFEINLEGDTTVLRGGLPDQAALHGVLRRIEALGIEIVEVRQVADQAATNRDPRLR